MNQSMVEITTKRACKSCGVEKPLAPAFFEHRGGRWFRPVCRDCKKACERKNYWSDPDASRARKRAAAKKLDKGRAKSRRERFHAANPHKQREYNSRWRSKPGNAEIARDAQRRWKEADPTAAAASTQRWREKYPDRYRKTLRDEMDRRRKNPKRALSVRMSAMVSRSLRNGYRPERWEKLVGYSVDELRRHIERQFTDGMSWAAFGRGEIHIDHIRPVASFDFISVEDEAFRECFALTNLRPLFALDNLRKGAKRTFLI